MKYFFYTRKNQKSQKNEILKNYENILYQKKSKKLQTKRTQLKNQKLFISRTRSFFHFHLFSFIIPSYSKNSFCHLNFWKLSSFSFYQFSSLYSNFNCRAEVKFANNLARKLSLVFFQPTQISFIKFPTIEKL